MRQRILVMVFLFSLWSTLLGCAAGSSNNPSGGQTTPVPMVYIQNKGSDTIVNLALAWAEQYQKLHPEVRISVTGGGSGTGIAALDNNTVDIANASRAVSADEIKQAQKNGYQYNQLVVAHDAIAVIVHPSNPVERLTLEQISEIFRGDINNWKELGGEDRPIVRLSRETNSGTHVYFLETVIRLGDKKDKTIFAQDTLLLPSSEGIIAEVSDNPNAIGYDGLGYITPTVKPIAIAHDTTQPYVLPSVKYVNANTYPISRDLYMYTRNEAKGAVKVYLDWILTTEAQVTVNRLGFVPIKVK